MTDVSENICFGGRADVYMCVYSVCTDLSVGAHAHMCFYMHVEVRVQYQVSSRHFTPYVLSQCLSLSPEFTNSAKLPGRQDPRTLTLLSPGLGLQGMCPHIQLFNVCVGGKISGSHAPVGNTT